MPMPSDLRTAPQTREMPAAFRFLPPSEGDDTRAETIELAFASAAEVPRWWGVEVLEMAPAAVRLGRLGNAGPLLIDHRPSVGAQVGVVESARIDADGIARAVVRFSRRPEAQAILQDVRDGILGKVSVGYHVHQAVLAEMRDGVEVYRVTDWEPIEISIVAVPADDSVGIGRNANSNPAAPAAITPAKETAMPAETLEQPAESVRSAETGTANRDAINITELATYAHKRAPELGIDRLGADFVAFAKPYEEFRTKVWAMLSERQAKAPAVAAPPAEIGLSGKQVQQFSILRASIAALTGNWKHAGFELECSRAVAERLGREARGFFVPLEVQRTMSTGDAAKGGTLVGTDHRADLFIESLRATAVAFQAGARMLPGLEGNVSIPRLNGNATFYWLVEGEDATDTDPATGAITMRPRTIAGSVPMTRRLLMQSSPAVEQLVREDLVRGAALALDDAIFEGDGAKQPLGIVNAAGVNTQAVSTDGSPTWAEMVGFESEVAADNALSGSLAYVTTPTVRGTLKTTSKDSGSGLFLLEGNSCNGYPVYATSQLAQHRIIFGNFADVIVGMWGVLEIKPDEAALAASGGLKLRVFQDVDVAIRHGESFCYGT